MDLTADEIRRFAEACSDSSNDTAQQVMLAVGAGSATGVLAKLLIARGEERQHLTELVRCAIREQPS